MSIVLVTDAARGSALAFIRSLGRAGHVVVAGDVGRIAPGRWSRSTSAWFRYPDPYCDPTRAAEAILDQVLAHSVDVILPVTDATTRVVESLRHRLPDGCVVGSVPHSAAAIAADKHRTVELADRLGVPVPATVLVEAPSEVAAAGTALGFPVVVKPISSLGQGAGDTVHKLEVGYAFDAGDLEQKTRDLGRGAPVLLQECCTGDGVGVEVLADRGRVVRAFSHRRIHEVPVTGGASALRESIAIDPELLEHTVKIMAELDWTGLAMVEFKGGPSGYRLMEINGRPWGSLPLAVRAGVDFPADYVRLLTGEVLCPPTDASAGYTVGLTARNLQLEIVWIASVLRGPRGAIVGPWPPRRAALASLVRLASPRIGDDVVSWRDPLPGVAELALLASKLLRKAGRH